MPEITAESLFLDMSFIYGLNEITNSSTLRKAPSVWAKQGESLLDAMKRLAESIVPPKYDRVAVHDMHALHDVPKRDGLTPATGFDSLVGIPVVVDDSVEIGVLEFRLRDEVHKRFHIAELRA